MEAGRRHPWMTTELVWAAVCQLTSLLEQRPASLLRVAAERAVVHVLTGRRR